MFAGQLASLNVWCWLLFVCIRLFAASCRILTPPLPSSPKRWTRRRKLGPTPHSHQRRTEGMNGMVHTTAKKRWTFWPAGNMAVSGRTFWLLASLSVVVFLSCFSLLFLNIFFIPVFFSILMYRHTPVTRAHTHTHTHTHARTPCSEEITVHEYKNPNLLASLYTSNEDSKTNNTCHKQHHHQ